MADAGTVTPPVLQGGPTAKEKKYDRQLRLWAASGQAALEDAHILLVNGEYGSGVVGIETLKNLVLPGIGQYTILDPAKVEEEDLGVNFFLDESSLGQERAAETCKFLQELNPDVRGHSCSESIESFLSRPDSLHPFTLIIVSAPIASTLLEKIVSHAEKTLVPVFYIHSVGFYAHFSIFLPPVFPIVDTHPDPVSTTDLRLVKPWPALVEFAAEKTKGLEDMDAEDHGHVPYVLLILHYLEEWKKGHDGKMPLDYAEKTKFKETVKAGMRTNTAEGSEENYEEAIAAVVKSLVQPSPQSGVLEVLNADECKNLTPESANFWIIASAIARFYDQNKVLPLPGSVPDMKAKSAVYIQLQNIYKSKAREGIQTVLHAVRTTEKQLSRSTPIEESEVEAFCKNAAHIKLVRGRPFLVANPSTKQLYEVKLAKKMVEKLLEEEFAAPSLVPLFVAFLAYDDFCQNPENLSFISEKAPTLVDMGLKQLEFLLQSAGVELDQEKLEKTQTEVSDVCLELARANGGELHNISALTGGLVAQEVIKAITKQYVPVDNTCLFDGIRSITSVLKV